MQKNRLNPTIKNVIFFKYKKILCKRKNDRLLSRFCRVCQKKSTFEELRSLLDAKGGCTNGAASIFHDAKGIQRVNDFSRVALTDDPNKGIRDYDMSAVNMEREFGEIEK